MIFINFGDLDPDIRHTAVNVGKKRAKFRHPVNMADLFPGQVIQTVGIISAERHCQIIMALLNRQHGLEHDPVSFLDILAHGVEVSGEAHTGREQAFSFLAFAFSKKLLPPFCEKSQVR